MIWYVAYFAVLLTALGRLALAVARGRMSGDRLVAVVAASGALVVTWTFILHWIVDAATHWPAGGADFAAHGNVFDRAYEAVALPAAGAVWSSHLLLAVPVVALVWTSLRPTPAVSLLTLTVSAFAGAVSVALWGSLALAPATPARRRPAAVPVASLLSLLLACALVPSLPLAESRAFPGAFRAALYALHLLLAAPLLLPSRAARPALRASTALYAVAAVAVVAHLVSVTRVTGWASLEASEAALRAAFRPSSSFDADAAVAVGARVREACSTALAVAQCGAAWAAAMTWNACQASIAWDGLFTAAGLAVAARARGVARGRVAGAALATLTLGPGVWAAVLAQSAAASEEAEAEAEAEESD
jgi:hypothetical protein